MKGAYPTGRDGPDNDFAIPAALFRTPTKGGCMPDCSVNRTLRNKEGDLIIQNAKNAALMDTGRVNKIERPAP